MLWCSSRSGSATSSCICLSVSLSLSLSLHPALALAASLVQIAPPRGVFHPCVAGAQHRRLCSFARRLCPDIHRQAVGSRPAERRAFAGVVVGAGRPSHRRSLCPCGVPAARRLFAQCERWWWWWWQRRWQRQWRRRRRTSSRAERGRQLPGGVEGAGQDPGGAAGRRRR